MSNNSHIILIEDDESNRRSLERALKREGYRVAPFPEARPGLEYLRNEQDVVLVITDMRLPGMDGMGVSAGGT